MSVAFAVYVKDRQPEKVPPQQVPQPASLQNPLDENGDSPAADTTGAKAAKGRFEFYDMLPNFEVIIPEQEPDVAADLEPQAVIQPGLYVLQAGSFSAYVDADRRRAELALHGIESQIQRVMIDDNTYHRVRIGPTSNLDELFRELDRSFPSSPSLFEHTMTPSQPTYNRLPGAWDTGSGRGDSSKGRANGATRMARVSNVRTAT